MMQHPNNGMELCGRVEVLQKQACVINDQLQTLQKQLSHLTGCLPLEQHGAQADRLLEKGSQFTTSSFSRQVSYESAVSTTVGDVEWNRQFSDDNAWDSFESDSEDKSDGFIGLSRAAQRISSDLGLTLGVQNTFITVGDSNQRTLVPRRSKSMPPKAD